MDFELLDETQVSALTGIKVSTLQFFRRERRGPQFLKIGRLVRYRRSDIQSWINASAIPSHDSIALRRGE